MKRALLTLCVVLHAASPARSEIVHCGKGEGFIDHSLTSGRFTFAINHPFKILPGDITGLAGSLTVNPKNLREGLSVRVAGAYRSFNFVDARVSGWAFGRIEAEKATLDTPWEFVSRAVDVAPGITAAPEEIHLTLFGQLTFHNVTRSLAVPLDCRIEASHWKCSTKFDLRMSDYAVPRIEIYRVGPRDEVTMKGDVIFAPPKKETDA